MNPRPLLSTLSVLHRAKLHAACLAVWLLALLAPATSTAAPEATLRGKFGNRFHMGVALDGRLPDDYSTNELELIRTQFAAITPANCMKMDAIQHEQGRFNFNLADAFVAFAESNNLKVCGHTLVWAKDERTPAWVFKDGDQPVSKEVLFERMRKHIETVAGRYRGKVVSWDVVNEVLDDGTNAIRASKWFSIGGEEFIAKAFEYAHAADPNAILILNDYNIELPFKRAKLLRLLRSLKEKNVPIQAVGIQGHYELDSVPFADIAATITAIQELGLKVMITEFDIDVIPRARWWADGGSHHEELAKFNPYTNGCPADVLQRQAEQYGKIFAGFLQQSNAIARITFWDLHDGRSWLNHFPWQRVNHPLLFDRQTRPKPAFDAVIRLP